MYAAGFFRTMRLNHPVISVGNLTLGGTGKTPLVMALAERFRDEGFRPVILSRGYKRSSKGILVVSRGDGPIVQWQESGDEPFLIARRVKNAAVVVGANRFEAGQLAEREGLGNLFILDDGFQHRRLFRNVDLVTIDPAEWAGGEKLLPLGRWREPQSAIQRADAACIQEKQGWPALAIPIPSFAVQTRLDGIYKGCEPVDHSTLQSQTVVAFAGIAKPDRFFEALRSLNLNVSRQIGFRDHHAFTPEDIALISRPGTSEVRITTEKDAIRLEGAGLGDFLHLRISANIPEFDRLMELIRSRFT